MKFYPSGCNFTQTLLVMLVTNITSGPQICPCLASLSTSLSCTTSTQSPFSSRHSCCLRLHRQHDSPARLYQESPHFGRQSLKSLVGLKTDFPTGCHLDQPPPARVCFTVEHIAPLIIWTNWVVSRPGPISTSGGCSLCHFSRTSNFEHKLLTMGHPVKMNMQIEFESFVISATCPLNLQSSEGSVWKSNFALVVVSHSSLFSLTTHKKDLNNSEISPRLRQNAAEGSDYACLDFGAFAGDDESFDFSGLRHRAWQPDYVDKPTVVPLYIIDQCSVKQDLDGPGRALGSGGW